MGDGGWGLQGGLVAGMGALGLFVAVAQVSFGQIPKGRHITQKIALVFSDLLVFFAQIITLWLKRTGREDSVSQPGLSKQVRDHQHSSEVFSFLFTEEIYIGHVDLKKEKRAQE